MAAAALLMPTIQGAPENADSARKRNAAKSLYYSRQSYKYNDSTDQQYELARYARNLDADNLNAAFYESLFGILISPDTMQYARARQAMRRYVDTYPGDINEASLYALLCENMLHDPQESSRVQERLLRIYPERTDIYMSLAKTYQMLDSINLAVRTVRRYERVEGQDDRTVTTKASLLLSMGDTTAAIAAADSLTALHPDLVDAWMMRGSLFDFVDMPDSALVSLQRAEALSPYSFNPKMALSQHYQVVGDTVMSDRYMTLALGTNDLSVDEKSEGLSTFVSNLYADSANMARALPMVDALLAQDPDNSNVLVIRAAVEEELQMTDALRKTQRRLIALNPQNQSLWQQLMLSYIGNEEFKEAEQVYREALDTLKDDDPTLDLYMSSAYAMQEKPQQASEYILKAIHHYIPTYTNRMTVKELADTVKAREYRPEAVANFIQMYGDQLVSMKDTVGGFTAYEQALTLDPDNLLALNNYAYFLALRDSNLDRAAEMSLKTVTMEPGNGTYLDTYAYILFLKGDYQRAKIYQEMAIQDTKPEQASSELYEHYGDILFKLGQTRLAVDNWKKALEKEPDNELIKRKIKDETYYSK